VDFILPYLDETEARLWRMIERAPAPGRHPARNALFNIARATQIFSVDAEMAVFRCINAEEEAARAVFHALQRRKYPGSSRLKWRSHQHKAAAVPFIAVVGAMFRKQSFVSARIEVRQHHGEERLQTVFDTVLPNGEHVSLRPDPPFHLEVRIEGQVPDFAVELAELANEQNAKDVQEFVEKRASMRNELLYATSRGFMTLVGDPSQLMSDIRANARSLLVLYLLVDEHPQLQPFVNQALTAFLSLLGSLRRR
jgi:hypothetical protein